MEIQQPLNYKRSGVYPGVDVSLASFSSPLQTPIADFGFTQLPFDVHVPFQPTADSYGFVSGFQSHEIQLDYSRKRRKLNKNLAMSNDGTPASGEYYTSTPSASPRYDQYDHNQALPWSQWTDPSGPLGQAMSSPLAGLIKGVGTFFWCPICPPFAGRRQSGGYHALPDAPEMVGTSSPYITDKQPAMQMPLFEGEYDTATVMAAQHSPLCINNPEFARHATDFGLMQTPFPLSVPAQDTGYQQMQSAPLQACYTDQVGAQGMPYVQQANFMLDPAVSTDQIPVPYDPSLLDLPSSPPIPQPSIAPSDGLPAFPLVPDSGLPSIVPSHGWDTAAYDEYSGGFDILLPNQRGGKRGPFKDPNLRQQTAQTRKMGSCIRCRMQRIRCQHNPDEPNGACLTCKKVINTKTGPFPCLRYKITDIQMYKSGQVPGFEWTRRWNNNKSDPVQLWESEETKIILISDGYSKNSVELRVRRFVPQEGDKLERTWDHQGSRKSVSIPPYALMDLERGKTAYLSHIESSLTDAFQKVLGRPDGLLHRTYSQAWRLYKDPATPQESLELLQLTMKLWMSIRLSTTSGFIVGEETLGMPANILDETSPNPGKIPVPPVLGAQLDLILIQNIQSQLRRELLDKLQKTIIKNKHSFWFVTYLVTFILLHNTALITAHDASYALKHGMKRRFAREDKVKEYHMGANILLAHFHYCNKGSHPFADDCDDLDLQSRAELTDDELQFVRATRAFVKRYKREWETARDDGSYEHDFYFVSQLFEDSWLPRSIS